MDNDQIIKNSFIKVKDDIKNLERTILEQNKEILLLKEQINRFLNDFKEKKDDLNADKISTGNNGVNQSINQSISQASNQAVKQLSTELFKNILDNQFKSLSKQELKTFLTIYQLEEEKDRGISYEEISASMSLSTSCIRSYASNLIKKGLPLIREKIKNKHSLFSVKKDFRALNLKQKLISLYYESNSEQTKLLDI